MAEYILVSVDRMVYWRVNYNLNEKRRHIWFPTMALQIAWVRVNYLWNGSHVRSEAVSTNDDRERFVFSTQAMHMVRRSEVINYRWW